MKQHAKHSNHSRRYEKALRDICKEIKSWNTKKRIVAIDSKVANCTHDYAISIDDMVGNIRNIALAALGEDELVPGTPDQHYPVLVETDLS